SSVSLNQFVVIKNKRAIYSNTISIFYNIFE
ncbi:hypothetical protein SNEBB_010610, partial [Seison nebaliae]